MGEGRPAPVGQRGEQAAGVGVPRVGKQLPHRRLLDDLPGAHHRHLVGHFRDHPEIVGDEQDRHPKFGLQAAHQIEDLRLNRHIERRGRLIGDQQRGLAHQRERDQHALPHAAGKLMGPGVVALGRARNLNEFKHLKHALAAAAGIEPLMHEQGFPDLIADWEKRIQRRHRLLEDHRDMAAAQPPHRLRALIGQVHRRRVRIRHEPHPPCFNAGVVWQQAHQRQRGDRFPGTALPHEGERLPAPQLETRIPHRGDRVLPMLEPHAKILQLEYVAAGCHAICPFAAAAASRRK